MTETGLHIITYTQHWVCIGGHWYREAWARDASGHLGLWAIPDPAPQA
jgi:hypothetical protein